jgi:hypothetical protein
MAALVTIAITFVLMGVFATVEAIAPFLAPCRGLAARSKKILTSAFLLAGLWGLIWYLVVILLKYPANLEVGGAPLPYWSIPIAAIVLAQGTGRIEAARVPQNLGRPPADREGLYRMGLRVVQARLYVRALESLTFPSHRLAKGLAAAYTLRELLAETAYLDRSIPGVLARVTTQIGPAVSDRQKRRLIAFELYDTDAAFAVHLAEAKATLIVDRHAF